MKDEDHLKRHLELCKAIFLRLRETGEWPWPDSTDADDLVESEDHTNDV